VEPLVQSILKLCARPLARRVAKMRDPLQQLPALVETLRASEQQAKQQIQLRRQEVRKTLLSLDDIDRRGRDWAARAEQAVADELERLKRREIEARLELLKTQRARRGE
jgi:hypothetical protein